MGLVYQVLLLSWTGPESRDVLVTSHHVFLRRKQLYEILCVFLDELKLSCHGQKMLPSLKLI